LDDTIAKRKCRPTKVGRIRKRRFSKEMLDGSGKEKDLRREKGKGKLKTEKGESIHGGERSKGERAGGRWQVKVERKTVQ